MIKQIPSTYFTQRFANRAKIVLYDAPLIRRQRRLVVERMSVLSNTNFHSSARNVTMRRAVIAASI